MATETTSLIANDVNTNNNNTANFKHGAIEVNSKRKDIHPPFFTCTKSCFLKNKVLLSFIIIASVAVLMSPFLFRLSVYYFQKDIPFYLPTHHHTVPTFLSVRDNEKQISTTTNAVADGPFVYVNALENDVYEKMKGAIFSAELPKTETIDDVDEDESITYSLSLDKDMISVHDSITLHWEYKGTSTTSKNIDKNEDVIALYCPASEQRHEQFLDAATLRQVEITSLLAASLSSRQDEEKEEENTEETHAEKVHQNQWFIPSFPVVKYSSCEFRLWTKIENKANENVKNKEEQQEMYQLASKAQFRIKNGSVQPSNIHLAFTNDANEMSVSFSSGLKGLPMVVYGKSQEDILYNNNNDKVHVQEGTSQTYTSQDLCEGPANIEEPGKFLSPGMLHSITMTELDFDSIYFYKVGVSIDDKSDALDSIVWSDVYSFKSNIAPGEAPSFSSSARSDGDTIDAIMMEEDEIPMKLVVYADQGLPGFDRENAGDVTSIWSKREIETHGIRAVHHFGDLAYAMGSSHVWDAWMDSVSIFARHVPLMVGIGNHEYDHIHGGQNGKDPSGLSSSNGYSPSWGDFRSDSHGECAVPVTKRFTMPSNGNGVFWYSFDQGLVHTIMMSSEHDTSAGSDQYTWLERDLQSVDRTKTPWLILELHRPMYMIEDIHENTVVGQHMRRNFEHLLQKYNVDLVLSGHYHSYFRSCPGLYRERCDNGGPLYVTIGTAGAELDRGVSLLRKSWSKLHLLEWGYGRLSVYRQKMLLEFVSDSDGVVEDSYWLYK